MATRENEMRNGFALVHAKEGTQIRFMTTRLMGGENTVEIVETKDVELQLSSQFPSDVQNSLILARFTYQEGRTPLAYELTSFDVIREAIDGEPSVMIQMVQGS